MCCCSIDWVSALCHCPVKSKGLSSCKFWCDGPTGILHTAGPMCLHDLRTVLQASVHSQNRTPSWGTPVLPRHTTVTHIRSSHLTAVNNPCIQRNGKSKVLHILNLRRGNGKAEDFAMVQPSPLSRHFSWESRQLPSLSRNSMPFMRLHGSFYYIFSSPPLHPIQSHLNPVHSVLYLVSFNIYKSSHLWRLPGGLFSSYFVSQTVYACF